jgi:hypothetical protein
MEQFRELETHAYSNFVKNLVAATKEVAKTFPGLAVEVVLGQGVFQDTQTTEEGAFEVRADDGNPIQTVLDMPRTKILF